MSAFKCPECGKVTGGNEKFCIECGQPLNVACPECGETWRFMFECNFCPACGHQMKKEGENSAPREEHSETVKKKKVTKVTR